MKLSRSALVPLLLWVALASGAPQLPGPSAQVHSKTPPFAVRTGTIDGHPDWRFWELTPDLARAELRIVARKGGDQLEAMLPGETWAAINGGYWMADYRPTGWVRDAKQVLRKKGDNKTAKVVAVADGKVHVGSVADLAFEPQFAIQNSPLLLEGPGKIGIRKDDGRRAARTVACRTASNGLRFVLILADPGRGPTLLETARLLEMPVDKGGFGCTEALNLDGGPSSGIWLREGSGAPSAPPLVPIGYGIAILEKSP
jgi:hypothetical protein